MTRAALIATLTLATIAGLVALALIYIIKETP